MKQQGGQPSQGQWAEQQKQALEKQAPNTKQQGGQHVTEGGKQQQQGDDRMPEKPIGQIAYADGQKPKTDGGAGKPQTSPLEPEKQGGIGGP